MTTLSKFKNIYFFRDYLHKTLKYGCLNQSQVLLTYINSSFFLKKKVHSYSAHITYQVLVQNTTYIEKKPLRSWNIFLGVYGKKISQK